MRRLFIAVLLFQLIAEAFAQAPERMSYQAVVRRTNNQLVNQQTVGMQISILQGSSTGVVIFVEQHTPQTDRNGVVSVEIGGGTIAIGTVAAIDWSNGPYFIQTEIDLNGGTNYTITGTSQLLTVPYAKLADSADKLTDGEQDPLFQSSVAQGITSTDTARWNTSSTGLDSAGVAAFGFVAGPHTVDTQIDSTGIAALGFVAGAKTVDTTLDSTAIAALGYVAGEHTVDTTLDSTAIAALGYVAGEHTVDTQIDSTGIASLGYVAGPHTVDTTLDSTAIAAMGFVANPSLLIGDETDPVFAASPASSITNADLANWNAASANNLDNDPTNEIQTLSYSNGTLTLSNGGGSVNLSLITTGFWATAPLHPGTGGIPSTQPCALVCPDGYAAGANEKANNCRTNTGSEGRIISASGTSYLCGNGRLALCFCVKTN